MTFYLLPRHTLYCVLPQYKQWWWSNNQTGDDIIAAAAPYADVHCVNLWEIAQKWGILCKVKVSREAGVEGGGNFKSTQGKWMTVTLPSSQLTVILAVGLTCWPYFFCAVCLIISGIEDLICVCKVDRWPSAKGTKVTVHPPPISFPRQQTYRRVFWEFGGRGDVLWDRERAICYYFQLLPNLSLYLPVKWH